MQQIFLVCFFVLLVRVDLRFAHGQNGGKLTGGRPLNVGDDVQYTDCDQLRLKGGYKKSGVYSLHRNNNFFFKAYCEHTPKVSYTVIQRRLSANVSFNREFVEYDQGFGTLEGDFWLGLSQIYFFTNQGSNNVLTIKMTTWDNEEQTVRYSTFNLTNNIDYTLQLGGFSGKIEDNFSFNSNRAFATFDSPTPGPCAGNQHAGWWYGICSEVLLNGVYYHGGTYTPNSSFYDGIYWKGWRGYNYSLKFVSMAISST